MHTISCSCYDNIHTFFQSKFGSSFSHYRRWGFVRVSQMFSRLPELCCVHFTDIDTEIISAKEHSCDTYKNKNLENINKGKVFLKLLYFIL